MKAELKHGVVFLLVQANIRTKNSFVLLKEAMVRIYLNCVAENKLHPLNRSNGISSNKRCICDVKKRRIYLLVGIILLVSVMNVSPLVPNKKQ